MANDGFIRQTAYRLWLSDLLKGSFVKSAGEFELSYAVVNTVNISRVNVMGIIVGRNMQEGYGSVVVDDGSAGIAVRVWRDNLKVLDGFDVGDIVLLVGKVRNFNNKIYLIPDFLRKLDNPEWLKLRKLELSRKYGEAVRAEESADNYMPSANLEDEDIGFTAVQEERVTDSVQSSEGVKVQKIISLIESEDVNEGADVAVVISKSGFSEEDCQRIIDELIKSGEIFEVKPGRVRTM